MKINPKILVLLAGLLTSGSALSVEIEIMGGDEGDACNALLCLSSSLSGDISECIPPLKRYYSISAKKMSDTIKKRKDFLKLCPDGDDPGMPAAINDIANGAGRCDAAQLNVDLREQREIQTNCHYDSARQEEVCDTVIQYRIINKMPSYCQAYIDNSYTDISLRYTGSPAWQNEKDFNKSKSGKWVN